MRLFVSLIPTALVAFVVVAAVSDGNSPSQPPPQPPPKTGVSPTSQRPVRDLSKWPFFPKQIFYSGQRGSNWVQHQNRPDGRFVPGLVPARRAILDEDNYLDQAAAALALAQAASYYGDDKAAAKARQAVLTLLLDTTVDDAKHTNARVCKLPPNVVNPLAAAAALVQAISELPAPAADLLDQSEQLCNGIRLSQQTDGSLACGDFGFGLHSKEDNGDANLYAGEALYALMLSNRHRPVAWTLEVVRKALPIYQARLRANKNPIHIPPHMAAFAEAFLQTGEKSFGDFVFEMADWLCTLQHQTVDPQHPLWIGGFKSTADSKRPARAPDASTAVYVASLAPAARVARKVGVVQRWERYKSTMERGLHFLTTLQFTDANTQHFAESYRPAILGAFCSSHSDGNIRLGHSSQAVCALVGYLAHVAEVP